MPNVTIEKIKAIEVLDSRGNPTILTTVHLSDGSKGESLVPSGASTGTNEALELRDNDSKRYNGKGVLNAVRNVNLKIAEGLKTQNPFDQKTLDYAMIEVDGTENKSNLGANAILSVSLAISRAAANSKNIPLYKYLRNLYWPQNKEWLLPTPMMNVLNGGKHAIGSIDLQEFMIMPIGATNIAEAIRWGSEVYHKLKKILLEKNLPVGVGDEGGFMPKLKSHEEALDMLVEAISKAGYIPGEQISLALDPAASEVYTNDKYELKTEGKSLNSEQMVNLYEDWINKYPIVSIEDGLAENDWDGFKLMMQKLENKLQIVGDDLFVTNKKFLQKGIDLKAANSILVKVNQIGTLTETVETIDLAIKNKMTAIISHRSGETEDSYIADLVVASGTGQIKTGAPCRSDRVSKYNRLIQIEHELGTEATYKNPFTQFGANK
ncbi:MAG: phosphopyruvate hydratase [Patescibacteria group bacterium]